VSATALRERLASLGARPAAARRAPAERRLPRGFEAVWTEYGLAYRLADVLPFGRVVGRPPGVCHAYLDTETTGLSGGTGTHVFAAAICRPGPAGMEIVQLFLADPAGEAAFLHLLQEELDQSAAVATYNGSSFDLPLLRTRWVMARMPGDLRHPEHLDLLTLTRALLRQRLESCTLRVVEDRLLGFEREEDMPGAMVPGAYFAYLRQGWSPTLEAALEHNRQDVLSLYHLHARLLLRLAGEDPRMEAPDWLALGRHLLRAGRRADGWRALRRAAEIGEGPASGLAALLLARTLARRRRPAAAEALLAGLQLRLPAEPALASARARLLEWGLRDLAAALGVVELALAALPAGSLHRPDLERRRSRLRLKLHRLDGRHRLRRPERQPTLVDEGSQSGQQGGVVRAGVRGQLLDCL